MGLLEPNTPCDAKVRLHRDLPEQLGFSILQLPERAPQELSA